MANSKLDCVAETGYEVIERTFYYKPGRPEIYDDTGNIGATAKELRNIK